jgi:hypothetical protein
MRQIIFVALLVFSAMLICAPVYSASEIVLDQVSPRYSGDTILAGCSVDFIFRLTNTDGNIICAFTNGFRVWTHKYGAYANNFAPVTLDTLPLGWLSMFDHLFLIGQGVDGLGEDTVGFVGVWTSGLAPGIPDGFDQQVWWVRTTPYTEGDTLCIDSSWFRPSCDWLWSIMPPPGGTVYPAWYGPYCFVSWMCPGWIPEFTNCVDSLIFPHCAPAEYTFCAKDSTWPQVPYDFKLLAGPGTITEINDTCAVWSYTPSPADTVTAQSLTIEVRDIYNCATCSVNLIFTNCRNRGNVDNVGGINVADVTYLVFYLFVSGPASPCGEDGNVDGIGGINVADLTYLVDYLFRSGPPPPPCP